MHKVRHLVFAVFAILSSTVLAQQPLRWEGTLETAKRVAAGSNRLVLAHFTAPYCQACHIMENEVFGQPDVAAALEANFVPVKINIQYYPTLAQQYGVTLLPTTIVIAPTQQGEAIDVIQGRTQAATYVARLNQVAMATKQRMQLLTQIPAAPRPPVAPPVDPRMVMPPPGSAPTGPPPGPPTSLAEASGGMIAAPIAPPIAAAAPAMPPAGEGPVFFAPTAQPPAGAPAVPPGLASGAPPPRPSRPLPPGNPPLGLEGFCPVFLSEKSSWAKGNAQWGAIHRGRTYLFTGADERQRFLVNPDRYAPVNSCEDVVLTVDQGRAVPGRREHGAWFAGRVFLFADEATLNKFTKNAKFYAERAIQALQADSQPALQLR